MALSLSGDGTLSGVDIAASGLGKVLQVVRATDSTDRNTTSTTPVDASISVTITPKQSTSAIILIWSFRGRAQRSGSVTSVRSYFQITDSSNNQVGGPADIGYNGSTSIADPNFRHHVNIIGYDTPATTSAVTYKGRFYSDASTVTTHTSNGFCVGQLYAIEVAA